MYNSYKVANRIKFLASSKKISIKQLLNNIQLGPNTMSNMKTSMPKADNLAKIADYLNCSVDYLLGRTENPLGMSNISENLTEQEKTLLDIFQKTDVKGRFKIIAAAINAEEENKIETSNIGYIPAFGNSSAYKEEQVEVFNKHVKKDGEK